MDGQFMTYDAARRRAHERVMMGHMSGDASNNSARQTARVGGRGQHGQRQGGDDDLMFHFMFQR
jgi:hypothetical protein